MLLSGIRPGYATPTGSHEPETNQDGVTLHRCCFRVCPDYKYQKLKVMPCAVANSV